MKRIRRVLYASDFSAASGRAFAAAVTMTIVYVLAPVGPTVPEQYLDAVTLDQLDKQARQWSARQLDKLAGNAKRAGVRAASGRRPRASDRPCRPIHAS